MRGLGCTSPATTQPVREVNVTSSLRPSPPDALVQLDNVSKAYDLGDEHVVALAGVDLSFRRGEMLVVLGPSGSGKTTLVQVASGLMRPDSGHVLVHGEPLNLRDDGATSRFRNTQLGFVFQSAHFVPQFSVVENVELPMTIAKVRRRHRRARALECLSLVGLDHVATRRISELSGGQRQRVSIARALTRRPEILFADEPTGNLDSCRGDEVTATLRDLASRDGVAVVMVTHNEDFVPLADRVVRMRDGVLTEVTYASR